MVDERPLCLSVRLFAFLCVAMFCIVIVSVNVGWCITCASLLHWEFADLG